MKSSVYILKCGDPSKGPVSYYTGSTHNLEQRLREHLAENGSLWSRCAQPVKLVYHEEFDNHVDAVKREKQIKGWSRKKKEALINGELDLLVQLSKSHTSS